MGVIRSLPNIYEECADCNVKPVPVHNMVVDKCKCARSTLSAIPIPAAIFSGCRSAPRPQFDTLVFCIFTW